MVVFVLAKLLFLVGLMLIVAMMMPVITMPVVIMALARLRVWMIVLTSFAKRWHDHIAWRVTTSAR